MPIKLIPADASQPFAMPIMDVSEITRKWLDVDYTPAAPHPMRKLDVYLPETGSGPFPTLVCIHGGAFWGGAKNDMQVAAYMDGLAEGFAVVSVEQRLCAQRPDGTYDPDGLFPNPVFDFKAAIRFLRANAAAYQLDPNRFAVCGGSAGGYHAIMAAAAADTPALYDASLGWAEVSDAVQAVVDWFGVGDLAIQSEFSDAAPGTKLPSGAEFKMDNFADVFLGAKCGEHRNLAYFAAPETWVRADLPPVLLQHGIADEIVPIECSRSLARRIAQVCGAARVTLEEFEGYTHGDARLSTPENLARVFSWLRDALK
ncbi:MAG: alpha/beta hydrolase [Oscillospiraceae bacterium]|jgi:acetyl esterase/lipase|nr:alpha/beta hydrolase [Oscillospiraceae bacterium]